MATAPTRTKRSGVTTAATATTTTTSTAKSPIRKTVSSGPQVVRKVESSQSPPFKITPAGQRRRWLKLMVYGEYGVGKTHLAGTAANVKEMRDVLLINAESGDLTLFDPTGGIAYQYIDQVEVTNYKTLERIHRFLKKHCQLRDSDDPEAVEQLRELEARLREGGDSSSDGSEPRRYRTVILDSLTEIESYCMYQLLGITDNTGLAEEVASAEWAEYKRQNSMIQRLIRDFRNLPLHVIIVCAARYDQDEKKRMIYTPALTGQLRKQAQGFMDMVGYLVTLQANEDGVLPRRLYVQPGTKYAAKNRFTAFKGSYIDNPTLEGILKAIGLSLQEQS